MVKLCITLYNVLLESATMESHVANAWR